MKYYLAGPMAGYPLHNFPLFAEAAANLRGIGLEIISPHESDHGESEAERGQKGHAYYLRHDVGLLIQCDAMILLPGYEKSKGVEFELTVALQIDIDPFYLWEKPVSSFEELPRAKIGKSYWEEYAGRCAKSGYWLEV